MKPTLPEFLAPTLEAGSVVQLRSGGHSMTIESVDGGKAMCVWSEKGRILREAVSCEVLKRSTEGTDAILIIPGLNASDEEVSQLMRGAGNA